ncbi:GDP-mannose 4,6-dehydratase [Chitinophaga barathri]|uniref:GDP-mannose 4,6-dehydratase n=1 Tax=Chitinophaga barathri TaxID=1647451 RepID=A0A3N4MAT3_9BACT|nr:GDP-mannose 4,6-dehydratase [Chitinophaga barathri]RPD40485.1 GDP-mannose 4,6-dehydratase [Chitinophaga barathri]
MKAIITGISGQDGAYLAKLLLEKGYSVTGITRNNHTANLERLAYLNIEHQVQIEECDLMDLSAVINLIKTQDFDEIYNLAAQSSVGLSFSQPIGTLQFNTTSVINLLEAIRLSKKNIKFYQASSSEMYGKVKNLPVTIETPMHPLSPYAISKASAYWMVVNYRESYGLYACNGVLFNHESFLRAGNFFVKKIISEAVQNKDNPDWMLKVGNIDISRDFGYSAKYVEAMWLMLQQPCPKDYIICSGQSVKLRSIIEYVFKTLNISTEKYYIDKSLLRPTDIEDIYGDNEQARKELNWDYQYSFFDVIDLLIKEEQAFINNKNNNSQL